MQHGTNSNTYAVRAGDKLLLFDAGCTEYQFDIMQDTLKFWGLEKLPVTHAFITHSHFDHAGNSHLWKKQGAKIYAGPSDAEGIETGDRRTIGHMFNLTFTPCKVDETLSDGRQMGFDGVTITALHMPGHSAGSMMFQIEAAGQKLLVMGDFLSLSPAGPKDDVELSLGWTGGPDYSNNAYLKSLKRALAFNTDILLPGHGPVFYGDTRDIFSRGYEKAMHELV